MLLLSVYAVGSLTALTFFNLTPETRAILNYADNAVCVLFLTDFLITLARSKNRLQYLKTWGWLDLVSSIPTIEPLRWGRAARILRIFRLLRAIKATKVLSEFLLFRRAQSTFLTVLLISLLLVVFGATGIMQFEDSPEANIKSPEDAVWWAVVTVTTVGYGDKFPLSTEGRVIAAILMVAGVGLFGTFSGFVASWFLEAPKTRSEELLAIDQLSREIQVLRTQLENQRRDTLGP
jgi:voltage-gated potassium channel